MSQHKRNGDARAPVLPALALGDRPPEPAAEVTAEQLARKRRIDACEKEVNRVLGKYDCGLDVTMHISGARVWFDARIITKS